jgi:diacylglycerol kinase (ATP)
LTVRIALVVNPAAGAGRAARLASAVEERLSAGSVVTRLSGDSAEATRRLLRAAVGGHDAVVTLGGDGTAHLALQELAGGDIPLGVLPAGTGNDMAAILSVGDDAVRAAGRLLDALAAGSVRRVDLGCCPDGIDGPRWWFTVLCSGFDAAVNETANRLRWPRGPRRYDVAIVREAVRLRPRPYRLVLDGHVEEFDATMVSVGNAPQYGGGKLIVPDARLDDGMFGLCIVGPVTRRTLLRIAPTLDVGGHVGHPAVRFAAARTVRLDSAGAGYADGERIGALPLTVSCVPAALPVLVPIGATPRGMAATD